MSAIIGTKHFDSLLICFFPSNLCKILKFQCAQCKVNKISLLVRVHYTQLTSSLLCVRLYARFILYNLSKFFQIFCFPECAYLIQNNIIARSHRFTLPYSDIVKLLYSTPHTNIQNFLISIFSINDKVFKSFH